MTSNILSKISSSTFEFKNLYVLNYLKPLLSELNELRIDERSNAQISKEALLIQLLNSDGYTKLGIKIDKYEIFVTLDDIGYSMFQISKNEMNSEPFCIEVDNFLRNALRGKYFKKKFFYKEDFIKSEFAWLNDVYPKKIDISLKSLIMEKLGLIKYDSTTIINYSSFY